ncbi:unnamed protein product [Zymoseptoria tritici ST99CH_3D1]|nr:unnamed protein product [Zymoseptoria tritici ST99CH_3D1]
MHVFSQLAVITLAIAGTTFADGICGPAADILKPWKPYGVCNFNPEADHSFYLDCQAGSACKTPGKPCKLDMTTQFARVKKALCLNVAPREDQPPSS